MVKKRLLDTDILTFYFRSHATVVQHAVAYLHQHDSLTISSITYYEILRGLRYINATRQIRDLAHFVADNEVLPLNERAIDHAADVYVHLRQAGRLINESDILIAGIALANDCVLVTNNVAHFGRIPNLTIENWWQEKP